MKFLHAKRNPISPVMYETGVIVNCRRVNLIIRPLYDFKI